MNLFAIGGAIILATGALVIWMSAPSTSTTPKGRPLNKVGHFAREAVPSYLRARTRTASTSDYERWLEKHFNNGGKVRHFRDEKMGGGWFVATDDFRLPPLSGEDSMNVIVPKGVEVTHKELGDNKLYHMKDGTLDGGEAELFTDVYVAS